MEKMKLKVKETSSRETWKRIILELSAMNRSLQGSVHHWDTSSICVDSLLPIAGKGCIVVLY
jgi:hypothetical protein